MDRVVFDTNIYISAFLFPGIPRKLLHMADVGVFQLIVSKQILAEFRGVLRIKFDYEIEQLAVMENLLLSVSLVVEPKKMINRITVDPTDNRILECAVEGNADYIVSGDKHLLQLENYHSIKIISPAEYFKDIC
jgi:putative PIN family toxin of toxin-antitoxin system